MLKKSFSISFLLLIIAFIAFATIPKKINYQGYLTDSEGNPITTTATTPLEITFSIYNSETTTTFLWRATYEVNITEGRFNILLGNPDKDGANKEIPCAIFDGELKYLSIKIGNDPAEPEMTPRKKLTSVAYSYKAHNAQKLGGKDPSAFIQTVNDVPPNSSGNLNLVAGSNVSITPDADGNRVTISATPGVTGGDITSVNAGSGLTGGATTGDASLHVGEGSGINVSENAVSLDTLFTDSLYYRKGELNTNDGNTNQSDDPVSWYKIKDIPAGFADGTDDVGDTGGISQINSGTAILVTNPTGPTATVAANVGTGAGQVAAGNHHHDATYVNENQSNSIRSEMITNGEVKSADIENNAVTSEKVSPDIVSSLDGVTNDGGNIDLVAGSGISITPNDGDNIITIATTGSGGDITAVYSGDGLSGGSSSGDVTLNIGEGYGISVNADDIELNTTYTDGRYVNENQSNSVSTGMIKNNAVTCEKIDPSLLGSIDGVTNHCGNVDLVAGSGISITPNDGSNRITFTATSTGDNLGDHTANQNIWLNNNWLSNDGGSEGIRVQSDGDVETSKDLIVSDDIRATGYIDANDYVDGWKYVIGGDGTYQYGVRGYGDTYGVSGEGNTAGVYGTGDSYGVYGDGGTHGVFGEGDDYGVYGEGDRGVYGEGGRWGVVAQGTVCGVWGWGPSSNYGVLGGNYGASGIYDTDHWGYFGSSSYGGYVKGNFWINGTLSKSAGTFKIDHPLDPSNKYLVHSFVESPDMMNVYNGNIDLNANGEATVELPGWFEALNKDFRYQLTPIGAPGPNLYIAEEISNNRFRIAGGEPGIKVSWQVTGIRQDAYAKANPIKVEMEKEGKEIGTYLYPELYNLPKTKSVDYEEIKLREEFQQELIEENQKIEEMRHQRQQLKLLRQQEKEKREREKRN